MANFNAFVTRLHRGCTHLFDRRRPVSIARVPGRLDVIGGIGDYSGCLVLEGLIDRATYVAVQARKDRRILVESAPAAKEGHARAVGFLVDDLFPNGKPITYRKAHALLTADSQTAWCSYVVGALLVLVREGVVDSWPSGVSMAIDGTVPFGGGVSSSASVEMASLLALLDVAGGVVGDGGCDPLRLAAIGQILENRIAGAPCGIMDQVTVTLGRKDTLLPILCQPHDVLEPVPIPRGALLVGVNSNVKHSIGGSRYTDTRVATFMGHRIVADLLGKSSGRFYLAELPAELWRDLRGSIPARMSGRVFIDRYGRSHDSVTRVDPDKIYSVRSRTEFPITERRRVETFHSAFLAHHEEPRREHLIRAGKMMYASHWWYGKRCGLGSVETDLLVRLARDRGVSCGIYGAKISGGGSGGTVALLIDRDAKPVVREVAAIYEQTTGRKPGLFLGSSHGGVEFGVRRV